MDKIILITQEEIREIVRQEFRDLIPQVEKSPQKKYNVEEAASYLGMPVPSFRQHQHKVGGVKIGKRWIFTQRELDRFIEKNRKKTADEIREEI